MFVTARTEEHQRLLAELVDALGAVEVPARVDDEVVVVEAARVVPNLVSRAHPTPADLREIVAAAPARRPALVIADRISDAGREVLRRAGWGWLDRRGHLRIWTSGLRLETPLPPGSGEPARSGPTNAWTTVGLEIALAALCEPTTPVSARRVAARIGRSVGGVHELLGRFAEVGLIGAKTRRPLLPELFWETAAQWPDEGWVGLPVDLHALAAKVGADELVRVDERAATLGGARIAAAGDFPARCYVRSAAAMRRARSLAAGSGASSDRDGAARCWVREAPVRWLPVNEDHPLDAEHPWHVAHPLLCALRLAADPARGREIVDAWGVVPGAETAPASAGGS